jgi:hypothetical protein
MSWFRRDNSGPTDGAPMPPSYVQRDVSQSARLATTPMPYDVESTHEPVIVYASAAQSLTNDGPDMGQVLVEVLQELGRQASRLGCDGVWSIQHTLAVDGGTMFMTAIGTGSRPTGDLDKPPPQGS